MTNRLGSLDSPGVFCWGVLTHLVYFVPARSFVNQFRRLPSDEYTADSWLHCCEYTGESRHPGGKYTGESIAHTSNSSNIRKKFVILSRHVKRDWERLFFFNRRESELVMTIKRRDAALQDFFKATLLRISHVHKCQTRAEIDNGVIN